MENEVIFAADAEDSLFSVDHNAARVELASARPFDDAAADLRARIETAQVVVPESATVVRMTVSPGEAIELPFAPDADFTARLGDGNLAIKVGDVVIILEGYQAAAEVQPPLVETADGKPLDIASILAATDPDIEIQTAAGPGGNQGGQGADNSGAIFQTFGAGAGGLGGFQGTGAQDGADGPGSGPGADGGQIQQLFAREAVNFAPTVEDVGARTDEDTALTGQVTGKDPNGDPLTFHTVPGTEPAGLTFNKDGTWTYDPAVTQNHLRAGAAATVTFQYEANDGQLDSQPATVTITVKGLNDTPTLSGDTAGTVTEDSATNPITGKLNVADPDDGESTAKAETDIATTYGKYTVDDQGLWSYELDNTNADVNKLGPNSPPLADSFFITTADGTQQKIDITINGHNDAPNSSDFAVALEEDAFTPYAAWSSFYTKDPDGGPLTFSTAGALHPAVTFAGDRFTIDGSYAGFQSIGAGETKDFTFQWKANDGLTDGNIATTTFTVYGNNNAPEIGGTGTALTYYTGDGAKAVAGAATVFDIDSKNFNGGSLLVSFGATGKAEDQLSIIQQGSGPAQIGISGTDVTYGGVTIGTFVGGTNGGDLLVTFTSDAATPAAAQALLSHVAYANSAANPSTVDRTVTFTLVDGDHIAAAGSDTAKVDATIHVSVEHAPVANTDLYLAFQGRTLVVSAADGMLKNDADIDGDPIKVAVVYTHDVHGQFLSQVDGSFTYTPDKGFFGLATLPYTNEDSHGALSNFSNVYLYVDALPEVASGTTSHSRGEDDLDSSTKLDWVVADADDTAHSITVDPNTLPPGVTFDPATGTLNYKTLGLYDYLAAGESEAFTIKFAITDARGGSAIQDFKLTMTGVADAVPLGVADTVLTNVGINAGSSLPTWALLANDKDSNTDGVFAVGASTGLWLDSILGGFAYVFADDGTLGGQSTVFLGDGSTSTVDIKNQQGGDITGSTAHEIIVSGSVAGAGDKLDGKGGKDLIFGGAGDDTLIFHHGDTVLGGGDAIANSNALAAAPTRGDVLAIDHDVDFVPLNLTHSGGIETISTAAADGGAGAQSLTIGASQVNALSDHTITPGNAVAGVFAEERAIRIDGDAVDQLYLSISKDGGAWSDTGLDVNGYSVYAHETTAGNAGTADAYVMVSNAIPSTSVHLNQDQG